MAEVEKNLEDQLDWTKWDWLSGESANVLETSKGLHRQNLSLGAFQNTSQQE
jgi:hypothetical protein